MHEGGLELESGKEPCEAESGKESCEAESGKEPCEAESGKESCEAESGKKSRGYRFYVDAAVQTCRIQVKIVLRNYFV